MACKFDLFLFLFFFFCFIPSSFSLQSKETETEVLCTNKWIHIRQIPQRFNLDLLKTCSELPLFDNFCPYIENHGLGPKTHNRSQSWYRTDPLLMEVLFHRRMLEYPCLTPDPGKANAIYLPYYAAIDSLKYLYGPMVNYSSEHGLDLFEFLQSNNRWIWKRNHGVDHFLVMSRQAWDFSQPLDSELIWGTSFLELPQFYNVTALIVEGRTWPSQEQAVPYVTSFHPSSLAMFDSWIRRVRASKRTTLMLFAGGGGLGSQPNIRRSIRTECENTTESDYFYYSNMCEIVDCSNGVCEHDPISYMRPMLQASFCLQPPGDTPTRRATFDGIIAGCIPVFFEEQSAQNQYKWHMPEEMYKDFSVFIPKEEVVFKGLKTLDVLMAIPRAQVRKMREKVIEMIPRVMYRKYGSSWNLRAKKDAFDVAIEGTLERIHSRLRGEDYDR